MNVDFTPIIESVLSLCAIAISVFGSWVLVRLANHFKVKLSADHQTMFDAALQKAVMFGFSQAQEEIKAKGWDHADVKNSVLSTALGYIVQKFPDAIRAVGLDPATEQSTILDALNRAFPAAATVAGASPVTPPTPPAAVPVVPVAAPVGAPKP